MAAGTGLDGGIEAKFVTYCTGGAVPAALNSTTITMRLITNAADATNAVAGTQCADTNYSAQTVAWGAPAQTAGNGSANGFNRAANTGALTYPAGAGSTGFAATFACHGYELWGGTTRIAYQNLAADLSIPTGQQLAVAVGAATLQIG